MPLIILNFLSTKRANLTKMTMALVEKDKRGRACLDYARYILFCRIFLVKHMMMTNMLVRRKRRGGNMMFI